jgi:hypothetical protein
MVTTVTDGRSLLRDYYFQYFQELVALRIWLTALRRVCCGPYPRPRPAEQARDIVAG